MWGAVSSMSGGLDSVGGIQVVDFNKTSELRWGFLQFLGKYFRNLEKICLFASKIICLRWDLLLIR